MIPAPKEIDQLTFNKLMSIKEKGESLDKFIQMTIMRGQSMIADLQSSTASIWQEIALKNPDIDFKNINWEPKMVNGKPMIVPVSMRL